MAKEIKQRIVLEGEKQYNDAIKEAQRNLRTLKSELKAETAELGKNATEQQKAEAKTKSLKAQIAEQEKIVKALKDALAEVKEKYGDNADEVAKWEQKLNGARTTLANMKNDLESVGGGFRTINTDAAAATVATKSVADSLGSLGSAGESVSGAIESIFSGLIDRVTDAVSELWDLIAQTAAKANNWTDIAGYWGTDAQTIQQYARAVGASANSFEDLQGAVSKIVMGGKTKDIKELLNISDVNYVNDWDYAMGVMGQLFDMAERGEDMDPIYEKIFGEKKSSKVKDLVNDWETIQELLPQFNGNETGYGMSDEELKTMNDLYVQIKTIEEKWNALKDSFAAGFGVASLDLLVNVEGTLDGIADFMNAKDDGEKQAALDKIRTNVEEFFRKLGEIIRESIHIIKDVGMELQDSDDPLTSAIGDILVSLASALEWMVDHQEEVKAALEAIFGVWIMGKLLAVAGQLGAIIMQIEAIKAFKGFSAVTSAAEAAGATAGSSWGAAFGGAVLKAVPWLAGLLVMLTPSDTGNDDLFDENGNPTALGQERGATQEEVDPNSYWGKVKRLDENGTITSAQYQALNALWGNYSGQMHTNKNQQELVESVMAAFGEENEADALEWLRKIRELNLSGNKPENLPLEWFGIGTQDEEEFVDLDEPEENHYTDADRNQALQDWWDDWKALQKGELEDDDVQNSLDWMQQVFGDDFGTVWDRVLQKLDEQEDQLKLKDIPEDWWRTGSSWSGGAAGDNGVTTQTAEGLKNLPAGVEGAAERGTRKGVSGMRVEIDGQTAGKILAPYVAEELAYQIRENY